MSRPTFDHITSTEAPFAFSDPAALEVSSAQQKEDSPIDFDETNITNVLMSDFNRERAEVKEMLSYPMLFWRVAARHGMHPSQLSQEFLESLNKRNQLDFERECAAKCIRITSADELAQQAALSDRLLG